MVHEWVKRLIYKEIYSEKQKQKKKNWKTENQMAGICEYETLWCGSSQKLGAHACEHGK
jgi:hypothetical protein